MAQLRYRFSVLARFLAADTDDINVTLAVVTGRDRSSPTRTRYDAGMDVRALIVGLQCWGADVRIEDPLELGRTA